MENNENESKKYTSKNKIIAFLIVSIILIILMISTVLIIFRHNSYDFNRYTLYTAGELMHDAIESINDEDDNEDILEQKYKGKYIAIEYYVNKVDIDSDYIYMSNPDSYLLGYPGDYGFHLVLNLNTKEQIKQAAKLKYGDTIKAYGEIVDFSGQAGYVIDTHKIEIIDIK